MTPKLNASIIEAQTGFDALVSVMAELQRGQDVRSIARIGNAAFEAQKLARRLLLDLQTTLDRAYALEAVQYNPPPAEPFTSSERSEAA